MTHHERISKKKQLPGRGGIHMIEMYFHSTTSVAMIALCLSMRAVTILGQPNAQPLCPAHPGDDTAYNDATQQCEGIGNVGCAVKYSSSVPLKSFYDKTLLRCVPAAVCTEPTTVLNGVTNECVAITAHPQQPTSIPLRTSPIPPSPPTVPVNLSDTRCAGHGVWNTTSQDCTCDRGYVTDFSNASGVMNKFNLTFGFTYCTVADKSIPAQPPSLSSGGVISLGAVLLLIRAGNPTAVALLVVVVLSVMAVAFCGLRRCRRSQSQASSSQAQRQNRRKTHERRTSRTARGRAQQSQSVITIAHHHHAPTALVACADATRYERGDTSEVEEEGDGDVLPMPRRLFNRYYAQQRNELSREPFADRAEGGERQQIHFPSDNDTTVPSYFCMDETERSQSPRSVNADDDGEYHYLPNSSLHLADQPTEDCSFRHYLAEDDQTSITYASMNASDG